MAEVYRIVTAEGHQYDYHGGAENLKRDHPGATIVGRRVVSAVGEGSYEPYSAGKARAAERKAAPADETATTAAPAKAEKAAAKKGDG